MSEPIVEGWTFPLDFQLLKNGVVFTAEELTGATYALILKDKDGVAVDTAGKVTSPSTSVVRFTPLATDLVAAKSPYSAHWKLTLSAGIVYVPKCPPDRWIVSKQ